MQVSAWVKLIQVWPNNKQRRITCSRNWQCNPALLYFNLKCPSRESLAYSCSHSNNRNCLVPVSCRNYRVAALQGNSKALTKNSPCCQVAGDKQSSALLGSSKGNDTFCLWWHVVRSSWCYLLSVLLECQHVGAISQRS